jgi:hypothetical protein
MRGIFTVPFSFATLLKVDNSSKLGGCELLRLEALSCPLHDSLNYEIDRHERRIRFSFYLDFPFASIRTLQRVTIARAVDSVPVVIGQTCSDDRRTSLDSALTNGRKEMNRFNELRADLVGYFLQKSFSSLDHVVSDI